MAIRVSAFLLLALASVPSLADVPGETYLTTIQGESKRACYAKLVENVIAGLGTQGLDGYVIGEMRAEKFLGIPSGRWKFSLIRDESSDVFEGYLFPSARRDRKAGTVTCRLDLELCPRLSRSAFRVWKKGAARQSPAKLDVPSALPYCHEDVGPF
jgi:hypothetical protein